MSIPNQLTVLRIALTPLVVLLLRFEGVYFRIASLLVFLIAALTDWYDGRMARRLGVVSQWGKFLDPLADKVLVLSTFFALAAYGYVAMWIVVVISVRDVVITLLRTYAQWKRQPIVTSRTAKLKTVCQMTAIYAVMLYLILVDAHAHSSAPGWLIWIRDHHVISIMMQVVMLVTVSTAIQYLIENRHHVRNLVIACIRVFAPGNLAK